MEDQAFGLQLEVLDLQGDQLGAAQRAGETHHDEDLVADPDRAAQDKAQLALLPAMTTRRPSLVGVSSPPVR